MRGNPWREQVQQVLKAGEYPRGAGQTSRVLSEYGDAARYLSSIHWGARTGLKVPDVRDKLDMDPGNQRLLP
ncbi:MAG: hypothetical protein IMW96_09925 [Thermoanaerobacteraceae bacterium]|nr:hypothetical protein [Thermoanaerobacteraceae bacterium]